MKVLLAIYIWLLIGDLLLALRRWEPDERWARLMGLVLWPSSLWWVARGFIRDWRTDLYYRTKHL